jgi:hypothetical protein
VIERMYSTSETAEILHCSPSQVLALTRQGRLRALKYTRPFQFTESEISRFITEELDRCNGGSSGAGPTVDTTPAVMISDAARSSATRSALMTLNGRKSLSTASSSSTLNSATPTQEA